MIRGLLIALAVGIAVWLLALLILVIVGRKQQARELAAAIPNLLVLFRGLLRDPRVPRGSKIWIVVAVIWIASPMFGQQAPVRPFQDVAQDQGRDDQIVGRPQHGDELGDEIDGRGLPDHRDEDPGLRASSDPRVTQQASEQDEEVGDRCREFARLLLSAR